MNDRWQQIERIYHAARELDGSARGSSSQRRVRVMKTCTVKSSPCWCRPTRGRVSWNRRAASIVDEFPFNGSAAR